jgi:hypothetical protein
LGTELEFSIAMPRIYLLKVIFNDTDRAETGIFSKKNFLGDRAFLFSSKPLLLNSYVALS